MNPILLVLIFAAASVLGYKIISSVPSLLHTPLMSGMNALHGIAVLAALTTMALAVGTGSKLMAGVSVILGMLNIAGGFGVTHRMLKMFHTTDQKGGES